MSKRVLRNVAAFVDGRNYAGECSQVTLPEVNIQTEESRAGGLDAPLEHDMGMEALRATVQFLSVPPEVMKLLGQHDVPMTFRGALRNYDGTTAGATAELRGRFVSQNPGDWAAGSQASFTSVMAVHYYKLTVDGEEVYEIDVPGMVRRINGEDQLAGVRGALGMG